MRVENTKEDIDKINKQTEEEYNILLQMFEDLLDSVENDEIELEDLEDIIYKRVEFAFGYCFKRFNLDIDEALDIVRNHSDHLLTPSEKERKDMLVAAIDNLIEFSVAAETHMYDDMENLEDDDDLDEEDIFERYNETYAKVENNDIDYASLIAFSFLGISDNMTLTYTTQGDERVRDSHRALEGTSYPKAEFPEWLTPPLDWGCRCYLDESYDVPNFAEGVDDDTIDKAVNPIFEHSLAKGGDIFSPEHPYFTIDKKYEAYVNKIVRDIKTYYNLG